MSLAVTDHLRLSKSRFLSRAQCHSRLWYDFRAREWAADPDDALQAVFDTGHEVGELTCRRYPGRQSVAHDHRDLAEALTTTRRVIANGGQGYPYARDARLQ